MKTFFVLILTILISASTTLGTLYLAWNTNVFDEYLKKTSSQQVPSLIGLSEQDALNNVQALGLSLEISESRPQEGAAEGSIISQTIPAGTVVAHGSLIKVGIAESMPKVPELSGMTLDQARDALQRHSLSLVEGESVADANLAVGQVVKTVPAEGQSLVKGASVTVHLSSGPDIAEVPSVRGLALGVARERITEAGFVPEVRWVDLAETQSYVILRQEPNKGDEIKLGSIVQLTVNR